MTNKTRLAKVEKNLTPQQVVLAYLAEIMRRFDSFNDWGDWVAENMAEAPLIKVARAAEDAVRNSVKGQPKERVAKAEEDAVREAIFLGKLFLNVTHKLLEDADNYRLQALFCARSLQLLLLKEAAGSETREIIGASDAKAGLNGIVGVRDQIRRHLGEVRLHQMAIKAIGHSYFAGRPILFPGHAGLLARVVQTAEVLAEEYNDFTKGGAGGMPEDLLIDLEEVRRRAAGAVRGEVTFAVRMTKADTLIALGMNEDGCRLAAEAWRNRQRPPAVSQPLGYHLTPSTEARGSP